MNDKNDLEKLIIGNKPVKCDKCNGKMFYIGSGAYECARCGYKILDDFGKVKQFLEENGPSPILVIAQVTGVKPEIIEMFLKKGRVEIPEGSKYYLQCERCGCSIKYGRYCPECVRELAGGIQKMFNEEMGEKPKFEVNPDMRGKMYFLHNRKR